MLGCVVYISSNPHHPSNKQDPWYFCSPINIVILRKRCPHMPYVSQSDTICICINTQTFTTFKQIWLVRKRLRLSWGLWAGVGRVWRGCPAGWWWASHMVLSTSWLFDWLRERWQGTTAPTGIEINGWVICRTLFPQNSSFHPTSQSHATTKGG